MTTWIDFKELRSKLRFSSLLDHYKVQLKVKGDQAIGFCPLPGHRGKGDGKRHSPSFSVNLRKGIFQCFSCGATGRGNALDFGCLMEGLNPHDPSQLREGALRLQEIFRLGSSDASKAERKSTKSETVDSSDHRTQDVAVADESGARSALPIVVNAPLDFELKHLDPAHPYLRSRGLTPETIRHFGLGYCSKGMMADRIAIPLHDSHGALIGYAGRLVDDANVTDENPKYRFPGTRKRKGIAFEFHKGDFLYNANGIERPAGNLIVVEGFASTWWLWQHGFRNAVALMGNSVSKKQMELLIDLLAKDGNLWILSDGDDAGVRCAHELLLKVACDRFVRWAKLSNQQPTDLTAEDLRSLLPSS